MKNSGFFWMILIVGTVLLSRSGLAEDASIVVQTAQGDIAVTRDGSRLAGRAGMNLQAGDVVQTQADGVTDIAWKNKWGFRLLGGSRCVLQSIDKQDALIVMENGNIIVNVQALPRDGRLRVSTPVAVAAVRGTQFWGRVKAVDGNAYVTFAVRKGEVMVTEKATGDSHLLRRGQALDIREDGVATVVRPALGSEMKAMEQADAISLS